MRHLSLNESHFSLFQTFKDSKLQWLNLQTFGRNQNITRLEMSYLFIYIYIDIFVGDIQCVCVYIYIDNT